MFETWWDIAQLISLLFGSILIIMVLFWWVFLNAAEIWEWFLDGLFPK